MKSSTGKYYIGLDHIRALAALMVFSWHFIHVRDGHLTSPPMIPFSLFAEGHTGVSLFMVLSGYLFAKLLEGRQIIYKYFLWNRVIRLLPLLVVSIFLAGLDRYFSGKPMLEFYERIWKGVVMPTLPNGGWSITTEFHFYLLLPMLLMIKRRWKYSLLAMLLVTISIRGCLYLMHGEVQWLSHWTIVGRIDQFLLGMLAYQFRNDFVGKHRFMYYVLFLFLLAFWGFDYLGGLYTNQTYPSPDPQWIYWPAVEGMVYALFVAWYDNSFEHSTGRMSQFIAKIGTYSYSIYLLHFLIVFRMAEAIDTNLIDLSNIYVCILVSWFCFLTMVPIAFISYTYLEMPFLKLRKRYVVDHSTDE